VAGKLNVQNSTTMRNNPIAVEICLDSVESAVAADRGGADRVELCADLMEGGITPSAGLIAAVRQKIVIGLQVMIRPRGGDFCYTPDEFDVMKKDVLMAKQLGADGVVFGILDPEGNVDVARARQLVDLARPMNVTHHRAFDMARDLSKALEDIIETGSDRILTSGGEATVPEGLSMLRGLVQAAGDRIVILPGGGVVPEQAQHIIEQTGVKELHIALGTAFPSPMRYKNPKIAMGAIEGYEYQRSVVRAEDVEKFVQSANGTAVRSR
jgi:copper homeostasis protein